MMLPQEAKKDFSYQTLKASAAAENNPAPDIVPTIHS